MPVRVSYPGVYVEEIPSGVRTITGVATSITAFIGRAPRGAANEPVTMTSFADFERQFGGLSENYPMSYAVRDFYANGGSEAIIVRLFKADAAAARTKALLTLGTVTLEAWTRGSWGDGLRGRLDANNITQDVADRYKLDVADLFNLTVTDTATGRQEAFLNVSLKDSQRRLDRVLAAESSLVRWKGDFPTPPPAVPSLAKPVVDGVGEKEAALTTAENELKAGKAKTPPLTPAELTALQKKVDDGKADVATAKGAVSGSNSATLDATAYSGERDNKTGLFALEKADLFNLLCIPPDARGGSTAAEVYSAALSYCVERRAMLIVDPPHEWGANKDTAAATAKAGLPGLGLNGVDARNAALYFPRVIQADPLRDGQADVFAPCGLIAGVMARTDTQRGVWKAPAGLDASLNGIRALQVNLTDLENGLLNPLGINCLRFFPVAGRVVWGARTLRGADQLADEYKYVPVRRLALYIEESLYRGTQWVVFEPNDEPLWAQIRLNVGAFMHNLFRQGAFQGSTPRDAYFVKCDKETTTQNDINLGIVNIVVGFAPLKPAEFVIIKLQQMAGQIQT